MSIDTTVQWVDKYSPKTLDDMVLDPRIKKRFEQILESKVCPNMILNGPPGTGKTEAVKIIIESLYGKYKDLGVLELNASDDRGIKSGDSVIYFCKRKMNIHKKGNFSKHKVVVLDEADNMTLKAQQLINSLMEPYKNTTRFVFTCNNSSDILEAIQSRCIKIGIPHLLEKSVIKRLEYIAKAEEIEYDNQGLKDISFISRGDMRQAINTLNVTYNSYKKINHDTVYRLCDEPPPNIIYHMLLSCKKKDLKEALTNLKHLINNGYSSSDIALSVMNILKSMRMKEIDEETRIKFIQHMSQTCMAISQGITTELQLSGCLSQMILG